jgi:hypothetical protein
MVEQQLVGPKSVIRASYLTLIYSFESDASFFAIRFNKKTIVNRIQATAPLMVLLGIIFFEYHPSLRAYVGLI